MRTPRSISLVLPLAFVLSAAALRGDEAGQPPKGPKELAGLEYRLVGPPAGGRVSRVAGVPGDPLTYYAATASGGVWKSTDGGIRWKPVFDDQPTSSIGSIAVAPSDPNVVYVGSGEANIRGNVAPGQRHLQVHRRREDVAARLEAGRPDRHDGRPPDEPRRRVRGRPRQALRPEPRARRLSHARTAGRRGRRSSTRTRTPAPPTSRSTRRTRASCSPACGRRGAGPGSW